MGTGIGHDLSAMLDHDPDKTFVLNQFYEADLDNFRKGVVRFQLPELKLEDSYSHDQSLGCGKQFFGNYGRIQGC